MRIYSHHVIDDFIVAAKEKGYEAIPISKGTLASGDWLLLSHDERPSFVIVEMALGSGQSVHWLFSSRTIHRDIVWVLMARFVNEAKGYQEKIEKITGASGRSFRPIEWPEGYKPTTVGLDPYSEIGMFVHSDDFRPDYAVFPDPAMPRGEYFITQRSDVDPSWDVMVRFGTIASRLMAKLLYTILYSTPDGSDRWGRLETKAGLLDFLEKNNLTGDSDLQIYGPEADDYLLSVEDIREGVAQS